MAEKLLFKLTGSSMYPLIREGSYILVKPTKKIFFGELVVFKEGDKIICHRLIFKKNHFFYSKSDTELFRIEKLNIENILGKVVMVIDFKKRIFLNNFFWYLKSLLFFFFTPILVIFLNFFKKNE
ncbi:MAG: S24 family peptidase [Candidatus Omnitrophica bacterium]|nr:S24 family peptidase [Candidatus Omnitrophota bacterium]